MIAALAVFVAVYGLVISRMILQIVQRRSRPRPQGRRRQRRLVVR